jgi:hypothetical protein
LGALLEGAARGTASEGNQPRVSIVREPGVGGHQRAVSRVLLDAVQRGVRREVQMHVIYQAALKRQQVQQAGPRRMLQLYSLRMGDLKMLWLFTV